GRLGRDRLVGLVFHVDRERPLGAVQGEQIAADVLGLAEAGVVLLGRGLGGRGLLLVRFFLTQRRGRGGQGQGRQQAGTEQQFPHRWNPHGERGSGRDGPRAGAKLP